MRRSEDRILTTHTGSLPRPPELTRLYVRRARGESVAAAERENLGRAALRGIVKKQAEANVDIGNNGEQQREGFFLHIRHRMSGFGGSWQRRTRADALRYPVFKQMMEQQLAAREAVSNMGPPKAVGEIRYLGPGPIEAECADFQAALDEAGTQFVEPFLTAPSPGIIAGAMKNEYYDSEEAYLAAIGTALREEYETIVRRGFLLQLDCPDLALVIAPADMQAHLVARNVFERGVDRRDDALDKTEEVAERPVLVRQVAFEGEVRAIEL